MNGGPSGDLNVVISVRPHPIFVRDGYDVHCEIPITYTQAVLGDEITVPTIDGKVKYTIAEGTQTGTIFPFERQRRQKAKTFRQRGSICKGQYRGSEKPQ